MGLFVSPVTNNLHKSQSLKQACTQTKILTKAVRTHFGFFIYNFSKHTKTVSANENKEHPSRTNCEKRDGIETAPSLAVR